VALEKADVLAMRAAERAYRDTVAQAATKLPDNAVTLVIEADGSYAVFFRSGAKIKEVVPTSVVDLRSHP
jgi:hypothetical protein